MPPPPPVPWQAPLTQAAAPQSTHAAPAVPQAFCATPGSQTPSERQQPVQLSGVHSLTGVKPHA
jgi:hypothetical protein